MRTHPFRRVLVPASIVLCAPLALAGGEEAELAHKLFDHAMGGGECAPTAEHECDHECEEAYQASLKLGSLLVKSPAAFEAVAPKFREAFEEGAAARDKALGFLASCGSDGCVGLGNELFDAEPKAFGELHLLAFAEAGSEAIAKELAARVEAKRCESVLPAAWFAFRGEGIGKVRLAKAFGAEVTAETVDEVLLAGAALSVLGKERALVEARSRVHQAVLAALDAGQLDDARRMALTADALREPIERACSAADQAYKAKQVRLSGITEKLGWHVKQKSEALAEADQVFELIEDITPLS